MSQRLRLRRRALLAGLAVTWGLSACQAGAPVAIHRTAVRSVAPDVSASPRAGTAITPVATATPAPVVRLQKPTTPTVSLHGTVTLDASYLAGVGSGSVLATKGGSLFVAGTLHPVLDAAGNVIANNSAGLVANNGGSLVSDNGGAIVANNGGGIVANNSGNLVAPGGLNAVASGGAGLVPEGGGALLPQGKAARHVLAAPDSPAPVGTPVADGTVLPAAGVRLSVISLATNTPVPVGVDEKGQPVYTIYSNAAGQYELYLPAEVAGNVHVVANVRAPSDPAAPLADPNPRLRFDIVGKTDATADIDEDQEVVSRFLLEGMTSRILPYLTAAPLDLDGWKAKVKQQFSGGGGYVSLPTDLLAAVVKQLNDESNKQGIASAPPAFVAAIARRVSQIALADYDGTGATVRKDTFPEFYPYHPNKDENAIAAMIDIVRTTRTKLPAFLPPNRTGYIERQPFFVTARCNGQIDPGFRIEKPGDIGRFLVDAYLSRDGFFFDDITAVLASVGAQTLPPELDSPSGTQGDRFEAAAVALLQDLLLHQGAKVDQAIAYLDKHPYPLPPGVAAPEAPTWKPTPAATCQP